MLGQPVTIPTALKLVPHKSYERAQLLLLGGKRDQGKTTFATGYIEYNEPRILALDSFNDFHGLRRRLSVDDAIDDLLEYPKACRRRLVPQIDIEWDADGNPQPTLETRKYFEKLIAKLIHRRVYNLLLVLDELTIWTSPRGSELLDLLTFQGRRFGIRCAAALQRVALCPGAMQAEVTELVLFRTTRPRDLETVKDWAGNEIAESVSKLQVGQCVVVMP